MNRADSWWHSSDENTTGFEDMCYSGRAKLKFKSGCIPVDVKEVPTNVCLSSGNMGFISFVPCCAGCHYMITRATGERYTYRFGFDMNPPF